MNNSDASSPSIAGSASPRERLRLSGPSVKLDPTTHAVRGDIADLELAHEVFAPHYARALAYRTKAAAIVRAESGEDAEQRAQLAAGDVFCVLDISGGYAWGKTEDGTPGYVVMTALSQS
ncbi:hypothetical protein SPAN111604_06575 [Sphingomonas antarctica]|uniref:SH3 domain-containing protein n=1 Tax=Sphingomonas antarctica TaxID=2040274 RepID=UPI0039E8B686